MSTLEDHMEGIMNIFHQYSVMAGHPDTLYKNEMKKLITENLPNTIKNTKNPASVDKIFQDLDKNGDVAVDFEEFILLVSSVLTKTHESFHKQ